MTEVYIIFLLFLYGSNILRTASVCLFLCVSEGEIIICLFWGGLSFWGKKDGHLIHTMQELQFFGPSVDDQAVSLSDDGTTIIIDFCQALS